MIGRIVRFCLAIAVAGALIWRGGTFQSAEGADMMTPLLCVAAGLFVLMTAVAIFLKVDADPHHHHHDDVDDVVIGK